MATESDHHPLDPALDPAADAVHEGPDLPNIPLLDDALATRAELLDRKPTWRGWIHAATFPVAIALGVVLIVLADGVPAKVSSSVFVASSLLLFGVSALYHRSAGVTARNVCLRGSIMPTFSC
jgi:hemolysin III